MISVALASRDLFRNGHSRLVSSSPFDKQHISAIVLDFKPQVDKSNVSEAKSIVNMQAEGR